MTLSNNTLEITGIDNHAWIANGCDCQHQVSRNGTIDPGEYSDAADSYPDCFK